MNSRVKVIFFDVGNTLLFPNRERIHAPLAERGIVPNGEHLRDLECRTKNRFDGMMIAEGAADHSFWWMFYSQLLSEIGLKNETALTPTPFVTSSSPASATPRTGTRFVLAPPNNCTRSASATGSPSSPMLMEESKTCYSAVESPTASAPSPTPGSSDTRSRTRKSSARL